MADLKLRVAELLKQCRGPEPLTIYSTGMCELRWRHCCAFVYDHREPLILIDNGKAFVKSTVEQLATELSKQFS